MWDTCTSHFEPKKFDRVGRGGPGAHLHVAGVVLAVFRAGKLNVDGGDVENKAT